MKNQVELEILALLSDIIDTEIALSENELTISEIAKEVLLQSHEVAKD